MRLLAVILLTLCLGVISCGPSPEGTGGAKTKVVTNVAEKAFDLFPASVGNAWTYDTAIIVQDPRAPVRTAQDEVTLKIVKVRDVGGAKEADVQVFGKNLKPRAMATFRITSKGVFQQALKPANKSSTPFEPPLPMIVWPIKPNQQISWSGTGYIDSAGAAGRMTAKITSKGEMEVDTPAGRMRAFRVDTRKSYQHGGKTYETNESAWFVPKIGLVRNFESVTTGTLVTQNVAALRSHTVK